MGYPPPTPKGPKTDPNPPLKSFWIYYILFGLFINNLSSIAGGVKFYLGLQGFYLAVSLKFIKHVRALFSYNSDEHLFLHLKFNS